MNESEDIILENSASNPLATEIKQLIARSRRQVATQVNSAITLLYWNIGKRIKQEVLKDQRAEYGQVQGFPASYEGCSSLLKHALSLNEAGMESRIHSGLVCTGDQFITNRTELDTIKQRFPDGLAVDMESAAIAQTCYLYNVPFLSFRIISDTPGVEDHASQYADFWGTMAERSFLTIWTFLSTLPSNL